MKDNGRGWPVSDKKNGTLAKTLPVCAHIPVTHQQQNLNVIGLLVSLVTHDGLIEILRVGRW